MIRGAAELLSQRGLQATSFAEVIAHTGASRGSIYHHFPGGKDELILEALRYVGQVSMRALQADPSRPATDVVSGFVAMWRGLLVHSELRSGCSVAAVTISADSSELLDAAAAVFESWADALASALATSGLSGDDARRAALTIVAALEGALILARAERDIATFDAVAASLAAFVRQTLDD